MKTPQFKIKRVKNPSGTIAYRLTGSVNGVQVRRNFKSKDEALAQRQAEEIRAANLQSVAMPVVTRLSEQQVKDAELVFEMLEGKPLVPAINFYLENYVAPGTVPLEGTIDQYLAFKQDEYERSALSIRQFKSIEYEMNRFKNHFTGTPIDSITAQDIERYLKAESQSLKTFNNRRGLISTLFAWAFANDIIKVSPISKVTKYTTKRNRGTATILSTDVCESLMAFLESYEGHSRKANVRKAGIMVPYFALSLFAGIRPDLLNGEMSKLRPQDINLKTDTIRIEPHASKTNEARTIVIQPNLKKWLTKYPLDEFPILPPNFRKMCLEIRRHFNLSTKDGHDVMRHTFISMLVAKSRSVGDTSLQAGNSEAIIRKHYLNVVDEDTAKQFWNIVPGVKSEKVIPFTKVAV